MLRRIAVAALGVGLTLALLITILGLAPNAALFVAAAAQPTKATTITIAQNFDAQSLWPNATTASDNLNAGNAIVESILWNDPKTGKTNWELDVFDKRTCASPILVGGLIWGCCGSGGGGNYVSAVSPGTADGSIQPREVWKITDSSPYVPTLLGLGDLVFLWNDKGVVLCVQASTSQV